MSTNLFSSSYQSEQSQIQVLIQALSHQRLEAAQLELDAARKLWQKHHDEFLQHHGNEVKYENELNEAINHVESTNSKSLGDTAAVLMLEISSFEKHIQNKKGHIPKWIQKLRGYISNLSPILSVPIRVISVRQNILTTS